MVTGKVTCYLCRRIPILGDEGVFLPCKRWFHKPCIASYLDFNGGCPVCLQDVHEPRHRECIDVEIQYRRSNDQHYSTQTWNSSQQRFPSDANSRKTSSNVSSSYGSEASSSASYSSAHSYASSASRTRLKRLRQDKIRAARLTHKCSYCGKCFTKLGEMLAHETEEHCLPLKFSCTYCSLRFDTTAAWKQRELTEHCEIQTTWFCMINGDASLETCLFCGYILPDDDHYASTHGLRACNATLKCRPFTTKQYLMGHMIEIHGMTDEEVTQLSDRFSLWSLEMNVKQIYMGGIWRCGYCGLIGADWTCRTQHIEEHWAREGPRFVASHRWIFTEALHLKTYEHKYIRDIVNDHRFLQRP